MNILRRKKGFALAEAIISLGILALSALTAALVMQNATVTTGLSRDYLIGQGLATEALEALKNIRNTNTLNKSGDRQCWFVVDPAIAEADCLVVGNQVATGSDYIISKKSDAIYELTEELGGELDLNDGADSAYQMYIGAGVPTTYNATGSGTASKFYRSVTCTEYDAGDDYASFTVKVQWMDGRKVRAIERDLTLYNLL